MALLSLHRIADGHRRAARGLERVELRYDNGLSTLIEVSDARLLLQRGRVNEAEATSAYLSALVALEHASGGQVPLVERALPGGST